MSKEEIEKILDQNEDIITYKADKDFRGLTSSERTLLENNKKIKEYIDQLEQENGALKKRITFLMASRKKWQYRYYNLKVKNKEDIEGWENVLDCAKFEMNQLEQENNKQNKMIDEMAKEINAEILDKIDWCKLYNKGTCRYDDTCLKCLKQYFKKKVEEEK